MVGETSWGRLYHGSWLVFALGVFRWICLNLAMLLAVVRPAQHLKEWSIWGQAALSKDLRLPVETLAGARGCFCLRREGFGRELVEGIAQRGCASSILEHPSEPIRVLGTKRRPAGVAWGWKALKCIRSPVLILQPLFQSY